MSLREQLKDVMVVIVWLLGLQTKVVIWNTTHGEVYSIQHAINFVNDLR